jgi:hypothetical protein
MQEEVSDKMSGPGSEDIREALETVRDSHFIKSSVKSRLRTPCGKTIFRSSAILPFSLILAKFG